LIRQVMAVEIKLPLGPPSTSRDAVIALPLTLFNPDGGGDAEPVKVRSVKSADRVQEAEVEQYASQQDRETQREVLKRTSELASMLDRDLKFEVHEDSGIVQIQVIDTTDGRVVRKIPADEVLKLVAHIRERMSERVDVRA
jgi:flagellar protein FlaG